MKKLFALLLLPSLAFAGKIGENYVGVELGATSIDFKRIDAGGAVSTDANGFSWEISGNYNLYQPGAENYGLDLLLSYANGSGDDSGTHTGTNVTWTSDSDISLFSVALRPHYDLGGFKIFADLGLFHQDIEIDVKNPDTTKVSGDSSEFIYGGGFELTSGKFAISPSFSWTESPSLKTSGGDTYNGNDTMTFSIPVSYSYSNNIDITASFSAVNNDDFINASTSAEKVVSESTSWGIGIDYKF